MQKGSCLCGAVQFEVSGEMQGPSVCHCSMCRKQSGHLWASAYVPDTALKITQGSGLRWYASSKKAKRGFCDTCGSFLFWKMLKEDSISFSLGSLDQPTGVRLQKHIFVGEKGDYYDISDNLPQMER